MFVKSIDGPFSKFETQEFSSYASALKFAGKVNGTIDGPLYDYNGERYYVVTFTVRNYNMTRNKR